MLDQHVYCPELHGTPAVSSFVGDSDIVITPAAPSSLPAVCIVPSTRRQVLFNGHARFFSLSLFSSPFFILLQFPFFRVLSMFGRSVRGSGCSLVGKKFEAGKSGSNLVATLVGIWAIGRQGGRAGWEEVREQRKGESGQTRRIQLCSARRENGAKLRRPNCTHVTGWHGRAANWKRATIVEMGNRQTRSTRCYFRVSRVERESSSSNSSSGNGSGSSWICLSLAASLATTAVSSEDRQLAACIIL